MVDDCWKVAGSEKLADGGGKVIGQWQVAAKSCLAVARQWLAAAKSWPMVADSARGSGSLWK